MQPIDDEFLARAAAWCREAGRPATAGEVREALASLGWDELLAVRALLADPPPARPLGPMALADIARGASPGLAARREREGGYPLYPGHAAGGAEASPGRTRAEGKRGGAGPFIRRLRDRRESVPSEPARLPLADELFTSEGRTILERLVRENGARRSRIVEALAAGWRHPDGSAPGEDDLSRLLDVHGLTRGFERRERDELLHALRAAAGLRTRAAAAVGLAPAAFDSSLERLGATREAESIRAAHRDDLGRRATLSERVRMLLGEPERLEDLGLLAEIEADVRRRLPQHLRALRASGAAPLLAALARSLTVEPHDVGALAARLGLDLTDRPPAPAPPPASARGHAPPRPTRDRRPPLPRGGSPTGPGRGKPKRPGPTPVRGARRGPAPGRS